VLQEYESKEINKGLKSNDGEIIKPLRISHSKELNDLSRPSNIFWTVQHEKLRRSGHRASVGKLQLHADVLRHASTHTYTHTHTYIPTHIPTHTHTHTHVYVSINERITSHVGNNAYLCMKTTLAKGWLAI
jgi:hypothetical protein